MKIALSQIGSTDDKDMNLKKMAEMIREAAAGGAQLIVFPEFAMFELPVLSQEFVAQAEELDGPFVTGIQDVARELGVTVAFGMLEKINGENRAYNTIVVVGRDGEIVVRYRKLHLYDAFGDKESDFIRPGAFEGPTVFEVAGVKVGILTCYDLRFPEATRVLADEGVELTILPASWVPGPRKEDHWKTLLRARAIENTFFVAGVGQAPKLAIGGSLLVDPMGVVVGELGEREGVGVYSVDTDRILEVRSVNPCLTNRRFKVEIDQPSS